LNSMRPQSSHAGRRSRTARAHRCALYATPRRTRGRSSRSLSLMATPLGANSPFVGHTVWASHGKWWSDQWTGSWYGARRVHRSPQQPSILAEGQAVDRHGGRVRSTRREATSKILTRAADSWSFQSAARRPLKLSAAHVAAPSEERRTEPGNRRRWAATTSDDGVVPESTMPPSGRVAMRIGQTERNTRRRKSNRSRHGCQHGSQRSRSEPSRHHRHQQHGRVGAEGNVFTSAVWPSSSEYSRGLLSRR